MITTIRKSFTKGVKESFGLIIVFAIVGGMLFIPGAVENIRSGIWAIKVNNQSVEYQVYMREVMNQRERLNAFRAKYGQFADYFLASMGVNSDPKDLAIDTLIKEELVNQLSNEMAIEVHSDYVNEKLNDKEYVQSYLQNIVPLFVFNENGTINLERLQQILPRMGLTSKEFEEKIHDMLTRQFLMSLVSSTVYTPEFDAEYAAKLKNSQRRFSIATIELSAILAQEKQAELSDEQIKSYYEMQNRLAKKYWVPEKRSGTVWKVDASDYGISVSDEQIAQYYEDNKVKKYVDTPIQIVMQRIVQTEKTGPLTDMYKDIVSGAIDTWEDVKPFTRGTYDTAIERAAFAMKPGEISDIITTDGGATVVIKLIERVPRTYKSLSQVQKSIRSHLIEEIFKQQFVSEITRLSRAGDIDALADIVFGLNPEVITNVEKGDEYATQLFAIKKGEYDAYVKGSTGYIITATNITPAYEPELDSIIEVVKNDIYEEQAQKRLKKEIELQKNALMQDRQSVPTCSLGWIDPQDKNQEKDLKKQGIPTYLLNNLEKVGSMVAHEAPDKGMIFVLEEIKSATDTLSEKEEVDFVQIRKMTAMEGLVASLYRNAKIETNETIIIASEEYSA